MSDIAVLLVEDCAADVYMLREALEQAEIRYDLNVAADGAEAIDFLKRRGNFQSAPQPALVILDLNLPVRNGWDVLSEIAPDLELHQIPLVILTSSTTDRDIVSTFGLPENCYLVKPSTFEDYVEVAKTIEAYGVSTTGTGRSLLEEKAKEVVARCKNLPTIPAVALDVLRLSRAENVDLRQIAEVIVHDVALSGRLLSVVNSAFYGFPRKVSTVGQAVVMLGLSSVKALALGFSLALNMKQNSGAPYQSFWRRSLVMAVAARTFAEHKIPILREEAFTAGLLADMGVLAMGEAFGEAYQPFATALAQGHSEIFVLEAERRQFSTDHQEVAFFMADAWHLPELLTISIAHHHEPGKCGDVEPTIAALAGVLYAADLCAETFCGPPSVTVVESFERAAQQYVGVDQAACREMVAKLNGNVQEIAKLLEIEISSSSTSYAEIVQQANAELTRLTLASQQEYAPEFLALDLNLSPFHLPFEPGLFEHTDREFGALVTPSLLGSWRNQFYRRAVKALGQMAGREGVEIGLDLLPTDLVLGPIDGKELVNLGAKNRPQLAAELSNLVAVVKVAHRHLRYRIEAGLGGCRTGMHRADKSIYCLKIWDYNPSYFSCSEQFEALRDVYGDQGVMLQSGIDRLPPHPAAWLPHARPPVTTSN